MCTAPAAPISPGDRYGSGRCGPSAGNHGDRRGAATIRSPGWTRWWQRSGRGWIRPPINRRDVVLVTGPWMAGVSGVVAALRERLPQHKFVESTDLGPGDAPLAVVFVVSAAAQLTESDCALLDAAAEHTDVVVGVVSKIDVHRTWRDVLTANRDALAAHAPRYGQGALGRGGRHARAGRDARRRPGRRRLGTTRRFGYRAAKQVASVGISAPDGRAEVRSRRRRRRPAGTGRRVARSAQHGPAGAAPVENRAHHHAARPDPAGAGPVVLLRPQPVLVGARRTARGCRCAVAAQHGRLRGAYARAGANRWSPR